MRLIDADTLLMKMDVAIAMIEVIMKNLDLQDDAECQMELKSYRDIRDGIKDEPTIEPIAQPEQRWIPSSEKPPKEGSYLVWMPFAPPENRIAVGKRCDGYWNIKTPISAWMPLPEPYRGGDSNE